MGYTHYFPHQKVSKKVWNSILKDVRIIMDNLPEYSHSSGDCYADVPLKLVNGMGEAGTKPIINDEMICFNGEEPEYDHESFDLSKDGSSGFAFCKTARKPYDLIAQACLLIYVHHSPKTIDLCSDGDRADWAEAVEFVIHTLKRKVPNPMKHKY